MAWECAAGVNVIAAHDLLPQKSMTILGQVESSRVPIQKRSDMLPEGGRIEA